MTCARKAEAHRLRRAGFGQRAIARALGISLRYVWDILTNRHPRSPRCERLQEELRGQDSDEIHELYRMAHPRALRAAPVRDQVGAAHSSLGSPLPVLHEAGPARLGALHGRPPDGGCTRRGSAISNNQKGGQDDSSEGGGDD